MSALPWNIPGPFVCHCSDCDAPPEPACVICRADYVGLNEQGECAECAPREDETCEEWADRVKWRRA